MGRIAPVVLLLTLGACSSSRETAKVPATPTPVPANVEPASQPSGMPPGGSSVEEVNELFRWLDAEPAAGATAGPGSAIAAARPTVIYTIPRANPALLAVVDGEAQQAAYQENLEGCLDGRFPAFCDHGLLNAHDAARVREAEIQANVATCTDPAWRHLCRPELLPADGNGATVGAGAPATVAPGTGAVAE